MAWNGFVWEVITKYAVDTGIRQDSKPFCKARRSELRSIRKFANVCWVINDLTAIIDGWRM